MGHSSKESIRTVRGEPLLGKVFIFDNVDDAVKIYAQKFEVSN